MELVGVMLAIFGPSGGNKSEGLSWDALGMPSATIFRRFLCHLGRLEVAKSIVFTIVSVHFQDFLITPLGRHLGAILAPFCLRKSLKLEACWSRFRRKIGPERLLERT